MTKYEFPNLSETYYEHVLENGLRVRIIEKKDFAKYYALLATDYGSLDTAFWEKGHKIQTPDGVAHYLEHKMFDLPQGNAMQRFSQLGGSPNAFTSYNLTAYYVECTQNPMENLQLLLEMVGTPYFTEESVEKERGIIAQEIKMYEDSPDSKVYENLFAALYATHPVRVPIAGTVQSIQAITADTLRQCYRTFYDPSNLALCVAGNFDPEEVIAMAEKTLSQSHRGEILRDYGPEEVMGKGLVRREEQMEVSMPTFVFGFGCSPESNGEKALRMELLGDLAAEVLAGESTPFYMRLYEQGLIDCDFSGGFESVRKAAFLSFSGDSKDPDGVFESLLDEMTRIERQGIDQALFQRLKKSALGRRMRSLDSFENCCYRCVTSIFEGAEYYRFPEIYQSITSDEVMAFLKETLSPHRAAISIIYPKGKENRA